MEEKKGYKIIEGKYFPTKKFNPIKTRNQRNSCSKINCRNCFIFGFTFNGSGNGKNKTCEELQLRIAKKRGIELQEVK